MHLALMIVFLCVRIVDSIPGSIRSGYFIGEEQPSDVLGETFHKNNKRAEGCFEINNATSYQVEGVKVDILCNTLFDHTQALQVTYASNFTDCIDNCINANTIIPCIAVQWAYQSYGPPPTDGANSLCYLLWNMSNATTDARFDSARLHNISFTSPSKDNCASVGTTYDSAIGPKYDIYCNNGFQYNDLALTFASDISSCGDRCSEWNLNPSAVPCVGAAFDFQSFGPLGPAGGSQCWLKWKMDSGGYATGVDSIRIQGYPNTIPSRPGTSKSGLKGGEIAGIVVGALGGLVLVGAGGYLFGTRTSRHPEEKHSQPGTAQNLYGGAVQRPIEETVQEPAEGAPRDPQVNGDHKELLDIPSGRINKQSSDTEVGVEEQEVNKSN